MNMLNELKTVTYFQTADWVVFVAVLLATALAAFYGSWRLKRRKSGMPSAVDYLLMGRQLPLPLFVATLVATWYGGIFGISEITFNYGIYNFVTQGIFWYIAYIVFALFIADKIARYSSCTLPALTGRMFGPKSAKVAAVFTFVSILPVAYVLSIGMFLHMVFGISVVSGMILGTFFVAFYSAWGGLRAIVFSDIVQFFVMCASVLLVVVFSVHTFGGYTFLKTHLPAAHFTLTGGNSWLNTLVWGFIALSTLIDPSFYQRCFAAKSTAVVKKGILISTLIWFLFDCCTTAGALYARAVLPQAKAGEAYFFYAVQLLPVGLRGFFVAGILSIILSTLNSFLFIASNTLSVDMLGKRVRNMVAANRLAVFVVGAVAIGAAQLFHGSFKEIWLVLGSYFSACLLIPILAGYIYPERISDNLFTAASLSSAAAMTLWYAVPKPETWGVLDPFYIGLVVSLFILLVFHKNEYEKVTRIIDR